jgi:hypothetical protein
MRSRPYVEDALAVLAWPPHADPRSVYERVREIDMGA